MKLKLLAAFFLAGAMSLFAQAEYTNFSPVDPNGNCTAGLWVNQTTGVEWTCTGNSWQKSGAQTIFLTASYTNATTTLSNVGISFPVSANQNYHADCWLVWQGSAATTGPKWTFSGPASPTAVNISAISAITATTLTQGVSTAFSTSVNNSGSITTATNFLDHVQLGLINGGTAGTVQLQAAANGSGTLTIASGSFCRIQ